MKNIEKIIESQYPPKQTNVAWKDVNENTLKFYVNGEWIAAEKGQEEDSSDIFVAKYDETTNQQMYEAHGTGKILLLLNNDIVYVASSIDLKSDDDIILDNVESSVIFRPIDMSDYEITFIAYNDDGVTSEWDSNGSGAKIIYDGPSELAPNEVYQISSTEARKIVYATYYRDESGISHRISISDAKNSGLVSLFADVLDVKFGYNGGIILGIFGEIKFDNEGEDYSGSKAYFVCNAGGHYNIVFVEK